MLSTALGPNGTDINNSYPSYICTGSVLSALCVTIQHIFIKRLMCARYDLGPGVTWLTKTNKNAHPHGTYTLILMTHL